MAWLTGFSNRLKLTIDYNDIADELVWFPICIKLNSSCGITGFNATQIFDDLGTNKLRLAVTEDDEETQLYVEIEQWDLVAKQASLWVSKDGWAISDAADTIVYLYWESASDNSAYVGVTGSAPAEAVWDTNFKLVTHMNDNPDTSHVMDSTSNDNDGTKKGANEPIEATVQIGKGQDFDGSDDKITVSSDATLNPSAISVGAWVNVDTLDMSDRSARGIYSRTANAIHLLGFDDATPSRIRFRVTNTVAAGAQADYDTDGTWVGNWKYVVGTFGSELISLYINGVLVNTTPLAGTLKTDNAEDITIGSDRGGTRFLQGLIDEVQVSSDTWSPAWVGASYETQRDHFVTVSGPDYGDKGETLYYYREYFWKHLPKPEPIPPSPDASQVDWTVGKITKERQDEEAKEQAEIDKKMSELKEKEWLRHMRERMK